MTEELKFESGPISYREGEFISEKAEALAKAKREYQHTSLKDLTCCPIGRDFTHCIGCNFTDIVGYCAYPIDIQTEIEAGRARPLRISYHWPERDADYALREKNRVEVLKQRAFGKVDER